MKEKPLSKITVTDIVTMVSLRVCYFSGGIVNMYKQWLKGELDCSINDIALELGKLLQLEQKDLFGQ